VGDGEPVGLTVTLTVTLPLTLGLVLMLGLVRPAGGENGSLPVKIAVGRIDGDGVRESVGPCPVGGPGGGCATSSPGERNVKRRKPTRITPSTAAPIFRVRRSRSERAI
jgi:hypothetical protein